MKMLTKGDVIKTVEPDGSEITVKIDDIYIDLDRGSTLIYVFHTVNGETKRISLNLDNLQQWYKEAGWVKVNA